MQNSRLVYIIGFMGSGKSTVAGKLASSLKWQYIDLDGRIEIKAGKSIPQIFSEHGEQYFRNLEAEALRECGSSGDAIIAAGGGAPCHYDNMDYMLENGLTVYLKMTPPELVSRLKNASEERPLLKDVADGELEGFVASKLAQREKWYTRAHITINGFNVNIKLLAAEIRSFYKF